jgi:simple sugar transport system ATP-binding protein
MSTPLLELKNVTKHFGAIGVLEGIDFTISPGEVVALLGDNGAGKSTLIKIIAGFHRPSSGEYFWEGSKLEFHEQNGPEEARNLGVATVYQDLGLVESLSIARNFFLGRELTKKVFGIPVLDHQRMEEIVAQKLAEIGIRRKLDPRDPIAGLSGGERQAVAINRARFFGAKLLILDEPTSALSLRQTEQVLAYIKAAAESGIAVIFITHTLAHIEGIIDRITILYHGRKVGDFLPTEVNNEQVSSLITRGEMKTGDHHVNS